MIDLLGRIKDTVRETCSEDATGWVAGRKQDCDRTAELVWGALKDLTVTPGSNGAEDAFKKTWKALKNVRKKERVERMLGDLERLQAGLDAELSSLIL